MKQEKIESKLHSEAHFYGIDGPIMVKVECAQGQRGSKEYLNALRHAIKSMKDYYRCLKSHPRPSKNRLK